MDSSTLALWTAAATGMFLLIITVLTYRNSQASTAVEKLSGLMDQMNKATDDKIVLAIQRFQITLSSEMQKVFGDIQAQNIYRSTMEKQILQLENRTAENSAQMGVIVRALIADRKLQVNVDASKNA